MKGDLGKEKILVGFIRTRQITITRWLTRGSTEGWYENKKIAGGISPAAAMRKGFAW
jgi:hypothetical protein